MSLAIAISSCASINRTSDNSALVSVNDYHRGENKSITIQQSQVKEKEKEKEKEQSKKKDNKKDYYLVFPMY